MPTLDIDNPTELASYAISKRCVLMSLHISVWPASKQDKELALETSEKHKADSDMITTNKRLFKSQAFEDIKSYAAATRVLHHKWCQPWGEVGEERILSADHFYAYTDLMRERRAEFNRLCEIFFPLYAQILQDCQTALGTAWKSRDYPGIFSVREKFKFILVPKPVPTAGDFRINLRPEDIEMMQKASERDAKAAIKNANDEVWRKLYAALSHLAERCLDPNAKKIFATSVTNLAELADMLPGFNIGNDPEMDEMARKIKRSLIVDIKDLRGSDELKASVGKQCREEAEKIQQMLENLFS